MTGARGGEANHEAEDDSASDIRRWLRDLGALLALPALWVDHEPEEIITGLLSVLTGVLQLEGALARFDDLSGGPGFESWRPSGSTAPTELLVAIEEDPSPVSGLTTRTVDGGQGATFRVTRLRLALPWETGLVVVSSGRDDFPTTVETHLLRVAVSQAAIAIHTARRLAQEHEAREGSEAILRRHNELLRSLVSDIEPSLTSVASRVKELSLLVAEMDKPYDTQTRRGSTVDPARSIPEPGYERLAPNTLTRREVEVLGLLAQGLSNREIAGVMWVSDRTVERHITSVYRKIGVARRSEATAFALRHGVV